MHHRASKPGLGRPRAARVSWIVVGVLVGAATVACSGGDADPAQARQELVRVPSDASLEESGDLVAAGGVILIENGTHHGSIQVGVDDVTVRGESRNGAILDGELKSSNGVVATGERPTITSLTVRNYLQSGVLVTGLTDKDGAGIARGPDGYVPGEVPAPVPGYLIHHVTSSNNGLYGIYAFNRTQGVIRDNFASGGSDSGIYVGQCEDCNALVQANVASHNAVGLELANASNVVVVGNRIVDNRVGTSVLSNYLEAHGPSRKVQIVGNVIADNNASKTPSQASGGFGLGVGLAGTVGAVIERNLIAGNDNVGVWITSSEDFTPQDSTVDGNQLQGNGLDVVYAPRTDGSNNCITVDASARTVPKDLADSDCAPTAGTYEQPAAPKGVAFSDVELPGDQPELGDFDERAERSRLPDVVDRPELSKVEVPSADLLADGT